MIHFIHIILLLILGKLFCWYDLSAQVTAFGRITAEVIESINVSSEITKTFDFTNTTIISVGIVKQITDKSISHNVIIKSTILSNSTGDKIILNTTIKSETTKETILEGNFIISSDQSPGNYNGIYSVTMAYN